MNRPHAHSVRGPAHDTMRVEAIRQRLRALGAKPGHEGACCAPG